MRQNRVWSTSEHRRHQMSLATEQTMPHCVYPLLHPMQASSRDSLIDDLDVEPEGLQLPQSYQPMLLRRQLRELTIHPSIPPTGRFPSISG